jgi:hypothetical protein
MLQNPYRNAAHQMLHLVLVTPEACEAHGGAEFPGLGLLLAADEESALEVRLCFCTRYNFKRTA